MRFYIFRDIKTIGFIDPYTMNGLSKVIDLKSPKYLKCFLPLPSGYNGNGAYLIEKLQCQKLVDNSKLILLDLVLRLGIKAKGNKMRSSSNSVG